MRDANRLKKWAKRLFFIWIVFLLMAGSYLFGNLNAFFTDPNADEHAMVKHVLESTGISEQFESGLILHGSHGFRKFYSQTVFNIKYYNDRTHLMELIEETEGWTVETFTAKDYRNFLEVTWYTSFNQYLIADDIEFDAWYYKITTPSTGYEKTPTGLFSKLGTVGRGFEFAAYDKETGLFIFIDQFG